MRNQVYDLMNWRDVEEVVYSECDHPERILGPHKVEDGILVQAFMPGAKSVELQCLDGKKKYDMELEDEAGYFAVLIPQKTVPTYQYMVIMEDGTTKTVQECYVFESELTKIDVDKIEQGADSKAQMLFGAHLCEKKGQKGVLFRVYAPHAMRVSVVGCFNDFDGRCHQMCRYEESGIFELFIPGLTIGTEYQYEIKTRAGICMLKADPYAFKQEISNRNASIVVDENDYKWNDAEFLASRKKNQNAIKAISVYEVNLGAMVDTKLKKKIGYKEFAKEIIATVKDVGYTHVNFLPLMEYPVDASLGYQTIAYFAPTSRYGSSDALKYMINELHKAGIFVIMDFTPALFPMDEFGLRYFDGSNLYEPDDDRMKYQANGQSFKFDYAKPAVKNLLTSAALYWIETFHVDGLRVNALDTMLYTNYDRRDEDSVRNIYGGFENLEAVEFIKTLGSAIKKQFPGVLLCAQESNSWESITEPIKLGGLGFDYNFKVQRDQWLLTGKEDAAYKACLKMYYGYRITKPVAKVFSNMEDMNSDAHKAFIDLQKLYKKHTALQLEQNIEYIQTEMTGFGLDVYCRIGKKNELLLFAANQTGENQSIYIKVKKEGTYKLIFDTNAAKYGGTEKNAKVVLYALAQQIGDSYVSDDYYLKVEIPAYTMHIYQYAEYTKSDLERIEWMRLEARKQGITKELERLDQSISDLIAKKEALEATKKEIEEKMTAFK